MTKTTTTTDRFDGIRSELLTDRVRVTLDTLSAAQAFAKEAQDALSAARDEAREATSRLDHGAAVETTERVLVVERVAQQAGDPRIDPAGAIAVRQALAAAFQRYRSAINRPLPSPPDAQEARFRLILLGEPFRLERDRWAADPAGSGIGPADLLRQASTLLNSVDAYVRDHGDAPTGGPEWNYTETDALLPPPPRPTPGGGRR